VSFAANSGVGALPSSTSTGRLVNDKSTMSQTARIAGKYSRSAARSRSMCRVRSQIIV